jgi:hypothetical protein
MKPREVSMKVGKRYKNWFHGKNGMPGKQRTKE